MRSRAAAATALLSLVSVATCEALPADNVPIRCATICGPIVELSRACDPKKVARRGLDIEERELVTIVPAPTTFPPQFASLLRPPVDPNTDDEDQPAPATSATSVVSRLRPKPQISSSLLSQLTVALPPPPPPPMTSTTSTTSGETTTTRTDASSMSLMENGPSTSASAPKTMDAEQRCFCLNRSFDVAKIAALCTSCISDAGFRKTIMATCDFTNLPYTPNDDSIANNVQVSATRPTVAWGHNAGVSSDGKKMQPGTPFMGGIVLTFLFWAI